MRKQTPLTAKPQGLCIRDGVLPSPNPRSQFPNLIRMQNRMMTAAQLFQAIICLNATLLFASLAVLTLATERWAVGFLAAVFLHQVCTLRETPSPYTQVFHPNMSQSTMSTSAMRQVCGSGSCPLGICL